MAAPREIEELVERFERNVESYRSGRYNETQLRREFIDPFFKALGWDVDNERGYAEAYKDVVHEDAIKVGSTVKAPDYCFRIGGVRKFFVEAKKPSVNLKDEISPAFQLRRYSWSAKHLPLGILTDFEELAVYDGRIKPEKSDKASKARVKYLTYKEYVDRWDEIASIFSREEVLKGSFDRYVESTRAKRGTAEVDAAFLKDIESWRDQLARNIALRNPDLTTRELNFAVQRTIDRIVFLRICEDRGIEKYGWLQSLLEGPRVYPRLVELFLRADERYNSGLFAFADDPARKEPPDELTPSLVIDDKILKEIIKDLYYPDSPYEFSVVPPEILGQVYEQFLGKVISLTPGHRAKVEYKPEVRKAGGVYYTPAYIVEYIVENTVGKLLEGQTPAAASDLRILDPACGSGSFLIGAYQKLLDWHRDWYVEKLVPLLETGRPATSKEVAALLPGGGAASGAGTRRGNKTRKGKAEENESPFPIFQAKGGEWKLTTEERKRILLNNIYGVDIDPQAVEVTKLSLHLKVLEGESEETLSKQLKLFQERALPDLGENVKCGNSLIGWDILESNPGMSEEEIERINPFDWEMEFPEIMSRGGFNAVIGNPPYIQSRSGLLEKFDKSYYQDKFGTAEYQLNTYGLFLEKAVKLLNRDGRLGMIVPNYWLSTDFDNKLREFLFIKNNVYELLNVYQVFENVTVDTLIVIAEKDSTNKFPKNCMIKGIDRSLKAIAERLLAVKNKNWAYDENYSIESKNQDVRISFSKSSKLQGNSVLKEYFIFKFGMKPYEEGKGYPPQTRNMMIQKIYDSKEKLDDSYLPLLRARNIKRYSLEWEEDWIKYGENLAAPRNPEIFVGPRILIRRIASGNCLDGTFTENPYICNTDVITLIPKFSFTYTRSLNIFFFVGIILSRPCFSHLKSQNVNLDRAAFPKINANTLEKFPVPNIDLNNSSEKARHDRMVKLVENMLDLHRRLAETKTGHEKTLLSRQIEATDRQIDSLVYELYGLTAEEIAIVEDATR